MEELIDVVAEVYTPTKRFYLLGENNCLYMPRCIGDYLNPEKAKLHGDPFLCDPGLVAKVLDESKVDWVE